MKKELKVLLHIHLDGSIRLSTLNELIGKDVTDEVITTNTKDLKEYLSKFELPISVMQNKENLERISYELATDLVKDNVIYAEIRFAPFLHTKSGLTLDEVIESVLKGLKKSKLKSNLILCMMRGMDYYDNLEVIDLATKYLNKGVVGIDLAGDELSYKTSDFKQLFSIARMRHIPFTIHAGESDGLDSINSALSFKTKRIGHGIKAIDSVDTVYTLIKKNITLEVCPTSNVDTHVVDSYSNHPVKDLYDLGVRVTINTDNNTVSNINLTKEYEKLLDLGFTKDDFKKMNIYAIEASFISKEEKDELKDLIMKHN